MISSFKLACVAGIEIGIHYTWLVALALVTWSLADGFFPANYPGWAPAVYWLVGLGAALALFACVVVHELSHSLVARFRGEDVHSITLFIFGGVSNLKSEPRTPKDELLIAIVGPLTSFGLAALAWLLRQLVRDNNSPLGATLDYLTFVNVLLGAFNLFPGFPLDGGRVLRSLVWATTRSLHRATQIASYAGQAMAFLLILWGLGQLLDGNVLGGLWIAFIGWFLNGAAEATRQQQVLSEASCDVPVAALMGPEPIRVSPNTSVQDFVFEDALRRGQRAALVMACGQLRGIVSTTDARKIAQDAWPTATVGEIMTPTPLKTVGPGTDLGSALEMLAAESLNQLPVVQDQQVVGLLSRADVLRYLQLRQELHISRLPSQPLPSAPTL